MSWATAATATATTTRQTTSANTPTETVPPATAPLRDGSGIDAESARRGWWRWWYALPLGLAAFVVLGAAFLRVPYYAIAPGSAVATSRLVSVEPSVDHPNEAEIFLMTVSLRRVTALEALRGWLDPDIDVVEAEVIVPPSVPADQLRQFNLQLMAASQQKAVAVALDQLGEPYTRLGDGAQVMEVVPGSPAEGVLEVGDAVVGIDGERVTLQEELLLALGDREPGDRVELAVVPLQGEPERRVDIVLGDNPESPGRAFLGIRPGGTRNLRFEFPFEVAIEADNIGGPSGGLALTLEVLDRLTEGGLTGGRTVAAIGEIDLDGSVAPVGGIRQKVRAAERAGAEIFLVSTVDFEVADAAAGDDLEVVAVDSLTDALIALSAAGGDGVAIGSGVDPVA